MIRNDRLKHLRSMGSDLATLLTSPLFVLSSLLILTLAVLLAFVLKNTVIGVFAALFMGLLASIIIWQYLALKWRLDWIINHSSAQESQIKKIVASNADFLREIADVIDLQVNILDVSHSLQTKADELQQNVNHFVKTNDLDSAQRDANALNQLRSLSKQLGVIEAHDSASAQRDATALDKLEFMSTQLGVIEAYDSASAQRDATALDKLKSMSKQLGVIEAHDLASAQRDATALDKLKSMSKQLGALKNELQTARLVLETMEPVKREDALEQFRNFSNAIDRLNLEVRRKLAQMRMDLRQQ